MDKQNAKFILQSYRPDGADASNPDFAEALKVAAEDRDLGLWLAEERSHDAIFAESLAVLDIPDGLRDEILSVLEYEGGKEISSELDGIFIGAMADISPPAGLRDQIISAMEIENGLDNQLDEDNVVVQFPWQLLNMVAVAAIVILAATFIFPGMTGSKSEHSEQLNLAQFQMASGRLLSASYEVDVTNNTLASVNTWLESEGMPAADTVPEGLVSFDVEGGKKITLDNGVTGSMILFKKKEAGEFYLMVFEVDSMEDAERLASMSEINLKDCNNCPVTHFNITAWKDDDKAYLLLTKADSKYMVELF